MSITPKTPAITPGDVKQTRVISQRKLRPSPGQISMQLNRWLRRVQGDGNPSTPTLSALSKQAQLSQQNLVRRIMFMLQENKASDSNFSAMATCAREVSDFIRGRAGQNDADGTDMRNRMGVAIALERLVERLQELRPSLGDGKAGTKA